MSDKLILIDAGIVSTVRIRFKDKAEPIFVPKVWWLSRHELTNEQSLAMARLHGPVDVLHLKDFWALSGDDFIQQVEYYSMGGDIVYVVSPIPWMEKASQYGLTFRTFCCSGENAELRCVYEYSKGFRTNILGAHKLR